jgi:glucose-1-phosphate adenylyltransferase
MISPYQTAHSAVASMYSHRLEAILSMAEYIQGLKSDTVVLADCDNICNIDLNAVISVHRATHADVTLVAAPCTPDFSSRVPQMMVQTNDDGRIVDIVKSSKQMVTHPERSINIFVMNTSYLKYIVEAARAHNYKSLTNDILMAFCKSSGFFTYCYRGYVAPVSTFLEYYTSSIRIATDFEARQSLLGRRERPIYTNVHNSPPCLYKTGAVVSNSMIADDCVIEGTVENSILFRGVKVSKGAVVRNSILFGGTYIGENASVNCIVADKGVLVSDGCNLSGHDTLPFYIGKERRI